MPTNAPSPQEVRDALLHNDFLSFLQMVFDTLQPGSRFRYNWHLSAIARQLERVAAGQTSRLVITMPPRSLKSITISVAWVAWMLGRDPTLKFMCVSYASDLSLKLARDCRKVMTSDWYKRAFPNTHLERLAEHDLVTSKGGGRFSTSTEGVVTGRGGDYIIIDDPMKPVDAMSDAVRGSILEWASTTLPSRLDDKTKGAVILVMQRLHEDDLAGSMLEKGGAEHLNLPAIATEDERIPLLGGRFRRRRVGDLLHPDNEPQSVLDQIKREMGSAAFSAQYQQAPVPAEGNMIKRAWLRRYEAEPMRASGDTIIQSWDCASKTGLMNDYSVCVTALLRGRKLHIIDVYRGKLEFPDLRDKAIALAQHDKADVILIEDAAAGAQLFQELSRTSIPGVRMPIAIKAIADKKSRVWGVCGMIEAGEMLLPAEALWLADFERELLAFPGGRHDDQVDALAQLLTWFKENPPDPVVKPWFGPTQSYFMGR